MSVNVENINRLIGVIGGLKPSQFNMQWWASSSRAGGHDVAPSALLHNCGTCGCLGGWTTAIFKPDASWDDHTSAADALGIDSEARGALFHPTEPDDWSIITRAQAIRVLEHLRDTGEVDWSKRGRR